MARTVALAIIAAASLVGSYGGSALYWLYEDGFQGVTCSA